MTEATAVGAANIGPAAGPEGPEVEDLCFRPEVEDLAFRARALAQAHALTPAATKYRRWRIDRDAAAHPAPELASWAATAFLTGYCVRCVEQSFAGIEIDPGRREAAPEDWLIAWERDAGAVADTVLSRAGATLMDRDLIAATLDNVIGREIEKRNEHVREHLSPDDWAQFETFIAWWVMHGYAIGAVESARRAVTA